MLGDTAKRHSIDDVRSDLVSLVEDEAWDGAADIQRQENGRKVTVRDTSGRVVPPADIAPLAKRYEVRV